MTGEVTLTGRVLPVGGVREKVLAARRAGITTVLIPRHNEKDLIELPAEVKADVTFHLIDTLDDVVRPPVPRAEGEVPDPLEGPGLAPEARGPRPDHARRPRPARGRSARTPGRPRTVDGRAGSGA